MCFGFGWIEHFLIWLVVVGAVVAILKILVPLALSQLGVAGDVVLRIISIIVWAIVVIAIIYLAFGLITCLPGWR